MMNHRSALLGPNNLWVWALVGKESIHVVSGGLMSCGSGILWADELFVLNVQMSYASSL